MQKSIEHNYNVDVVRILAMFLVCVNHVAGGYRGMANAPTIVDRAAAVSFWSLAFVCVNLFMLITGYLGITRTWKTKSLLKLWGQVAFYCVGGLLLNALLTGNFSFSNAISIIFLIPFANGYWYFTAYTGAFFLFPYINKGFLALSHQEQKKLLLTLFIVICLFGFYNKSIWGGYNAVWLLVMYLAGAYIKLHPIVIKSRYLISLYVVSSLIGGILFSADSYMRHTYSISLPLPGLDYTSPFTVCASLACLLLCLRVKITSPWLRKVLVLIAPLTFAVYLIHTHPFLFGYFGLFARWVGGYSHYVWWHIPVVALLIFVFCLAVEYLRTRLFMGISSLIVRCKRKV